MGDEYRLYVWKPSVRYYEDKFIVLAARSLEEAQQKLADRFSDPVEQKYLELFQPVEPEVYSIEEFPGIWVWNEG